MAIIRSAQARNANQEQQSHFDDSAVPFVPAWDLLMTKETSLSAEEIAAVGAALFVLAPDPSATLSPWNIETRFDAVSRRL